MRIDYGKIVKEGLVLLALYCLISFFLLLYANRIERLEKSDFGTEARGIEVHLFK